MNLFPSFVDSLMQLLYALVIVGALLYWIDRFVEPKLEQCLERLNSLHEDVQIIKRHIEGSNPR